MVILLVVGNVQRLIIGSVLGVISYMVFHKDQFWGLYLLISISMTYFSFFGNSILQIMRTIVYHLSLVAPLLMSFKKLGEDSIILIQWYTNNYLKPNRDKWHLLLSESDNDLSIVISNERISNSSSEKILGVNFDNKLNFNTHITKLCKKAGQKLHALARMSNFMNVNQKKVIMNAFITSQFSYCLAIWMCHNRSLNTKINRIHESALRIVYNDNSSSYESSSVKIHHSNLQQLAVEIYKARNNLSSSLMSEIFALKNTGYNLRGGNKLNSNNIKSVNNGTETISYLAPKIWEQVPDEIKNSSSLNIFKRKIKTWIPNSCPCPICKTYIPDLGFI